MQMGHPHTGDFNAMNDEYVSEYDHTTKCIVGISNEQTRHMMIMLWNMN